MKLLRYILVLLGFSSTLAACDGCGRAEYGSPHADFAVKGKVTAAETGDPVKGIKVTLENTDNIYYWNDSSQLEAYTDDQGNYAISASAHSAIGIHTIKTEDVDGEANGGYFAPATETVAVKKEDMKGKSGNWYAGKDRKEVNITLDISSEAPPQE